jgi:hypothetical protein
MTPTPVENIEPYEGWVLWHDLYDYGGDRLPTDWWEARHPEHGTRLLQASGYSFTMTQERFEFLVRQEGRQNQVPCESGYQGVIRVPWTNEAIDRSIANAPS